MTGDPRPPAPARLLLILALLGGAGLFAWWLLEGYLPPSDPQPARIRADAPPDTLAVLVLPLEAVEPGEGEPPGRRAERIHELLVGHLREGGSLRVASGDPSAPPGSGRRGGTGVQGVEAVLAGEVVADGDRLRLTLRLTAAPSGDLLWSGSYEGRSTAVDELALTAARSVARELGLYAEVLAEGAGPPGGR